MKRAVAAVALLTLFLPLLGATPTSSFDAGSVHVDQYGSGAPALVLIPGLTDSGAVWATTVARYQGAHTIYVLTLPGFGNRPMVAAPMLDAVARDIAAFLRRANKPVLIGHSLGGFLAIRLAEEHSNLIRGAIATITFLKARSLRLHDERIARSPFFFTAWDYTEAKME
ncbi:MAG: alpha/beta fold hydrolase [Candidatus Cybelea sp.]